MLTCLGELVGETPHVEYAVSWVKAVCLRHGTALQVAHIYTPDPLSLLDYCLIGPWYHTPGENPYWDFIPGSL